jgi:C4-dicarboxylate transporter
MIWHKNLILTVDTNTDALISSLSLPLSEIISPDLILSAISLAWSALALLIPSAHTSSLAAPSAIPYHPLSTVA